MNIYVGNLNYRVKEDDLQKVMEDYGTVSSVKFIMDRATGRFRGIAFVEMEDSAYGKKIVSILGVKTKDWQKGPWWLYESSNNESCQASGQCDAASALKIKDGDDFTFNFQGM